MFCRSCWANLPDGTRECPKCQADPAAPGPVARPGGPAAAPRLPRKSPRPGPDRQTRLIVLVALLVLTLIAGPKAVEWAATRLPGAPARAAGPAIAPTSVPAAPGVPASAEPTAPPAAAGPEVEAMREAYALYQAGKLLEACDRYRDAVNRGGSPEARRDLGACLARLGREAYQADLPGQAVDYYQRALEATPEDRGLWAALATAHVKARDLARAQQVLEQAVQRFPEDGELLYRLAEVQERQGRRAEAGETLRRLLGRQPAHGRGRALLAALEREQKVESGYWSQESRHFLVRYEGAAGIDVGRSVVDSLEEAYDSIGRDLDDFPAGRIQVSVYSQEVLGQVLGVPAHFIRGAFQPDSKRIRFNIRQAVAFSNDLSRLVRHEYAHAVIDELSRGRAPVWLHEGLAQVLEPRPVPRSLDVSVPREFLTLRGIERLARTGDPVAFTAGYQLCLVAVDYLVDRGGLGRVRQLLVRLGEGQPMEPALTETFGFGAGEIDERLLRVAGRS